MTKEPLHSQCAPADEKPWAWLRMTRRQYDTLRLWKRLNMSREEFSRFVLCLPAELVEKIWEDAQAERLVEAIFGKIGNQN